MVSAMNASDAAAHPEPAIVASFLDRGEAEVVAAKLIGAGLNAVVVDEVEGGSVQVDTESGVVVAVPAGEEAAAHALLADQLTDDQMADDRLADDRLADD